MWNDSSMGYGGYGQQNGWQRNQMQRQPMGYGYGMQQPTSNMQWIRVHSAQEAREVSVQPGGEAWIMEDERPIFYFKRADAMGQVMTKAYQFGEISLDSAAAAGSPDLSQFATKADLEAIHKRLDQFDKFASELGGVNT